MARRKCNTTGKDMYPSLLECQLAIANLALRAKHHRHQRNRETATRGYKCNSCGHFHMTSKAQTENIESVGS